MKADRTPSMDDLNDPEIEWDEIRNRGMCIFFVRYVAAIAAVCAVVYWLRT